MAANLEREAAIPALMLQLPSGRTPEGQSAENERSRTESKHLLPGLPALSDQRDALGSPQRLLRHDQLAVMLAKN